MIDTAMEALHEAFEGVQWLPTVYTPSLTGTEDFITDGDALITFIEKYWKEKDVAGDFRLDDWQKWIIRHTLERYPADWPLVELRGVLRYRELIISMGRQNGKSVLGAIYGVYGLFFHEKRPNVIGLAYSKNTAEVVYDRVAYTVNAIPLLKKRAKVTKTQGITRKDKPGKYIIKPASEQAVQGYPMSVCIYDEVHITPAKLWSAAKQGTKNYRDGIVIGITTAGDDKSELLKAKYKTGYEAINNQDDPELQRFGFFLWEAPEGATMADDDAIKAANPAVASGRHSVAEARAVAFGEPEAVQKRYSLNRFVSSSSTWIDLSLWIACAGEGLTLEDRRKGTTFFGVDASASMDYVSIAAARKVNGTIKESLVWTCPMPSREKVLDRCLRLARKGNAHFIIEHQNLLWLVEELQKRGVKVTRLGQNEFAEASQTAHACIARGQVNTSNERLVQDQIPRGVRRNKKDGGWVISRGESSLEIDAMIASVLAIYGADRYKEATLQLF